MIVSNGRSFEKKVEDFFFRCWKAEQREVRATVTISLCVPIILCVTLAYTNLAAEQKW